MCCVNRCYIIGASGSHFLDQIGFVSSGLNRERWHRLDRGGFVGTPHVDVVLEGYPHVFVAHEPLRHL